MPVEKYENCKRYGYFQILVKKNPRAYDHGVYYSSFGVDWYSLLAF